MTHDEQVAALREQIEALEKMGPLREEFLAAKAKAKKAKATDEDRADYKALADKYANLRTDQRLLEEQSGRRNAVGGDAFVTGV